MADKPAIRKTARWWFAVGTLALLVVLFAGLGNWQLDRADQRRSIAQEIEAGRQAPRVLLSADTSLDGLVTWQPAMAVGRWRPEWSFLLDNRNLDSRPGLWLATPLELAPGRLLLVLRGWVARPIAQYNALPVIATPATTVTVEGDVATHIPRLFSLGEEAPLRFSWAANQKENASLGEDGLPLKDLERRQNVSLAALSEQMGQAFLPIVLMQTGDAMDDGLGRQWPQPSVDADKNVGYAFQWFGFAAIAFVAIGVLLWRMPRRAKIKVNSKDTERDD